MENFERLSKHIVLIGYTKTTAIVINELVNLPEELRQFSKIILVDENYEDEIDGVIVVKEDYHKDEVLKKLNLPNSLCVVIFSDKNEKSYQIADLRSVSTVFAIESIDKEIHTITEVQLQDNAGLILSRIEGDEVIIKELIDAKVVLNSIIYHYLSLYVYDLIGNNANKLLSQDLNEFSKDSNIKVKNVRDLKRLAIEYDTTLLGYRKEGKMHLISKNDDLTDKTTIYYYKNN